MRLLTSLLIVLLSCSSSWGAMKAPRGGGVAAVAGGGTVSYGSGSTNGVAAGTSVVVTAPTGISNGDLLVASVHNDTAGQTVTPPSGFSEIATVAVTSQVETKTYTKVASSESGDYTWGFSASTNANVIMMRLTKIAGTFSETDAVGSASATSVAAGPLDVADNTVVLVFGGHDTSGVPSTPLLTSDGMTAGPLQSGNSCPFYSYYQAYSTGATGVSKTVTWDVSEDITTTMVVIKAE